MNQTTASVLMVRPASFSYNEQTAESNTFQSNQQIEKDQLLKMVRQEFDASVSKLESFGVEVMVIEDDPEANNPDAVFPNNWISMHSDGKVILYPMCTPNRRTERRMDIIEQLRKTHSIKEVTDFSVYEKVNRFLEGTGSIIFDHKNKFAYACLSPRTDKGLFINTCSFLKYTPVSFTAVDAGGVLVYHTNVLMCLGEKFVVICMEAIKDSEEKNMLKNLFEKHGQEIIDISFAQMSSFAGNMLALKNAKGTSLLALSQSAFNSLSASQKEKLENYCKLIPLPITTIETIGGGSARCMIAENFLPVIG
ncbi:MAG: arginine deiminase-related protein [Ginsengibacter sp.]